MYAVQTAVNGGSELLIFVRRRAAHLSYHLKAESGTSTRHARLALVKPPPS